MKKTLKIFGIVLGIVLILIILIPLLFKGKILKKVQEEINNNINATVKFDDFGLSLFSGFPDLRLELENISVVGKDAFGKDTLASFQAFSADLNLLSVISGNQIKINAIKLDNARINAIILADGKANWDIAPSIDTTEMQPEETAEDEQDTSVFAISLKKFEIIDAYIYYNDYQSDLSAKIEKWNLTTGVNYSSSETKINIETVIEALSVEMEGIKFLKKVKMKFDAGLEADLEKMAFKFIDNIFSLNNLELAFEGSVVMPDDDILVDMKFSAKKNTFASVLSLIPSMYLADMVGIKTTGEFAFSGYAKGRYNEKNMPAFGLDLKIGNGTIAYPDFPKQISNINIGLKVDALEGTGEIMTINLEPFHSEIAGNIIDASMLVKTTVADVNIEGKVDGKIDLATLRDAMPLEDAKLTGLIEMGLEICGNLSSIENEEYQDFKADGMLRVTDMKYADKDFPEGVLISKTDLKFSPNYVALNTFDAKIGQSDFHLDGKIDNLLMFVFKDETLKANFNYNSNYINVNQFISESEPVAETASDTDTSEQANTAPVEIPSNIDFTLRTQIGKILYGDLEITSINGKIVLYDSKAALTNLQMSLLDGSLSMNGSYDSKIFSKPRADFMLNIENFDIQKTATTFNTVSRFATVAKSCKGKISTGLKLNCLLDKSMSPINESINVSGQLHSKSIGMEKSVVFNTIGDLLKDEKYKNPTLKDVNIGFKIVDGMLVVEPSKFKYNNVKAIVSGTINLEQIMDFGINLVAPRSEFGSVANDVVDNLLAKAKNNGLEIEHSNEVSLMLKIVGIISEPKISLNLKEQATKIIDEVVGEVKKKTAEETRKLIAEADKKGKILIDQAEAKAKIIRANTKKAGEKIIAEADSQGKALIKKAGNNPFKKKIAKESAKKLTKEAQKKADKLNADAKQKADALINTAKQQAAKLKTEAEKKANKIED